MPARVMPTPPSYMNPVQRGDADATEKPKRQQTSELTVCISLASLMDFESCGLVSQENWMKGMATLAMEDLGNDPKIWEKLMGMHGGRDGGKAHLDVQRLKDVVPIDPRVGVLLNAIVKGLVSLSDFVKRSLHKEGREIDSKRTRTIINIRKRITEPVFKAWRDFVSARPARSRARAPRKKSSP